MAHKKKQPSPPRIPPNSAKSRTLVIRVTPCEDAEIREAAAEAGLTIRDFLVDRSLHTRRLAKMLADAEGGK